jgi:long-chain acyl-CoA synthetase
MRRTVAIPSERIYEVREINNLKELLNSSVELFADKNAFQLRTPDSKPGESKYTFVTYKQFKNDVDALGTFLLTDGRKSNKIAIIGENRYEWAASYFGIANGSGIVVPIDKLIPPNEIEELIIRSEATAIIFSDKYRDIMKDIASRSKTLHTLIDMDLTPEEESAQSENTQNSEWKLLSFASCILKGRKLIEDGVKDFIDAAIDDNALGILLFTSGTTKAAKGVMLSHKNIASNIMDFRRVFMVTVDDLFLSFLPLHHTFEGSAGFLLPLYCGAGITYCDSARRIASDMKDAKISCMVSVPILFESMYKKVWFTIEKQGKGNLVRMLIKINNVLKKTIKVDFSHKLFKTIHDGIGGRVRLMVSGAAPIDPQVCQGFQDLGLNLREAYGLTETSPGVTANNDKYLRNGSCGKPFPSVKVEIDDPDSEGIGEIKIAGPNVMIGYYDDEESTKEALRDGWFHTGDLGYVDADGYLYITGRKKSMIVLKSGKKVFPEEIETLLGREKYISESMVYGKPKGKCDYEINAKIVYNKEEFEEQFGKDFSMEIVRSTIDEIVKRVNASVPHFKVIKEFDITDEELIKTTTRKVKRAEEMKKILGGSR